jgi:hypothetical protein
VSVGIHEFYKEEPEELTVDLTRKQKTAKKDGLTWIPVSTDTGRVTRGKMNGGFWKTVA